MNLKKGELMKKNIGKIDKTLRLIIGIIILVLGIIFKSWWGLLGVIPVITSFLNYCPLYCPLKISTIEKEES